MFDTMFACIKPLLPTHLIRLSRGEPAVCLPSPAGESLQLPGALLPPTSHHRCLSGSLSVHDDKVKTYCLLPYSLMYILI